MARLTLGHRIARLNPFVWIGAAAVIGALIAWPLGGWETVELESTKIPKVEPGTLVDGQQYSVAVESVEVTGTHPDGFSEPDPGWEWLILRATVTNMTDETQLSLNLGSEYFGVVALGDSAGDNVLGWGSTLTDPDNRIVDSQQYLVADDTFLPDLQPRLPAPLYMIWPVPVDLYNGGDTATVGIVDRSPYRMQLLGSGIGYHDPTIVALVELDVAEAAPTPTPAPTPTEDPSAPEEDAP